MRLHKLALLIATVAALIVTGQPTAAARQPAALLAPKAFRTPLIIGANNGNSLTEGDLWQWNGLQLIKRTSSGHNLLPIMSPSGDWIAFRQVTPTFVRQRVPHQDDTIEPPTDLYLYNLKTGAQTKIAGQPDKPVITLDNTALYTIRSEPSWAPDGTQLAWTEIPVSPNLNSNAQTEQLIVYDLATKISQVIVTPLPLHRSAPGFPAYSQVAFGPNGMLAVLIHTVSDTRPDGFEAMYIYDLTGMQLTKNDTLNDSDPNYIFSQPIWLTGRFQPIVSCINCKTGIDPVSGEQSPLPGAPEMYSLSAPDKLSTHFNADAGDEVNVVWVIALNGVSVSTIGGLRITRTTDAAISPDGLHIATASFAGQGTDAGAVLYNVQPNQPNGVTINVTGLAWGAVGWRLYPAVEETF